MLFFCSFVLILCPQVVEDDADAEQKLQEKQRRHDRLKARLDTLASLMPQWREWHRVKFTALPGIIRVDQLPQEIPNFFLFFFC